jgi:hypothetical protein
LYKVANKETGADVEASCRPYGNEIHIVWDQFWPDWSAILPFKFSYDPIEIFGRVLWHLRLGNSLPRRLPVNFRHCDDVGRDAYRICKKSRSSKAIAEHFHTWTSSRVSGLITFLEIWIDTGGRNDDSIAEIAAALSKLRTRKNDGRRTPFETMHDITFGNLIATLILNTQHSLNGIRAAVRALDAMLCLIGRQ